MFTAFGGAAALCTFGAARAYAEEGSAEGAVPPPPLEDTRPPCERLGGCGSFGGSRSKRKGGLSGFGTRSAKTNVSFSSRRRKHTSVFKAGSKRGRGSRRRRHSGGRKKRH